MNTTLKPPIMALDVGTVRIGIALSDPFHLIAQAQGVLTRKTLVEDLREIEKLVRSRGVETVIVGLPLTLRSGRSDSTRMAEEFYQAMKTALPDLNIELWDERLSTAQAEATLLESGMSRKKRKQNIDQVAATLILQNYLDRKQRLSRSPSGREA